MSSQLGGPQARLARGPQAADEPLRDTLSQWLLQPPRRRAVQTLSVMIWAFSWLPSLVVTEQAITGRDTPQARPRAALEGTKTYGTFCRPATGRIQAEQHDSCSSSGRVQHSRGNQVVEHVDEHAVQCWESAGLLIVYAIVQGCPHLVLGQQGQVQQNLDGLSVSSHDDELSDTAVQGLGGCEAKKIKP